MAEGIIVIKQNMTNEVKQGVARVRNVQHGQLPVEPQDPTIVPAEPVYRPPIAQGGVYTLEKFIKNGGKVFKGLLIPKRLMFGHSTCLNLLEL